MTKVSINIVTWNSLKFLPDCLESIRNQTYRDFSVLIIDNGSTDGTVNFIKTNYPEFAVLRNTNNLGFCKAHNQGIDLVMTHWKMDSESEDLAKRYILLANPDIILEPDFLEKLVKVADQTPRAASFGGKLLRVFSEDSGGLISLRQSNILDSAGIELVRNRSAHDRGTGEQDNGEFDIAEEVFGISGALLLLRAQALEQIKLDNQYLDEDFFMYKDDVDLAWRFRNAGWRSFYVPEARAYHFRSSQEPRVQGLRAQLSTRRFRSPQTRLYSYRNHWFTIVKNERLGQFLKYSPFIFWYEFKKLLYVSLFEPGTLLAIPSFLVKLPKMLQKRRAMMRINKSNNLMTQ